MASTRRRSCSGCSRWARRASMWARPRKRPGWYSPIPRATNSACWGAESTEARAKAPRTLGPLNNGIAGDWVAQTADRVMAAAERRNITAPIVCASGISPSGPIHLGNLREIMVPHLVADEICRRGLACRHVLSWDDYDRLRKVPAGFPAEFAEHIGRPLSSVPDPCGEHESWAEHFKAPFRAALAQLAVDVDEISQTAAYTAGTYRPAILHAMAQRMQIFDILSKFRTKAPKAEAGRSADDD